MNISSNLTKCIFTLLSIAFITSYTTTSLEGGLNVQNVSIGLLSGLTFGALFIITDRFLRKISLKIVNTSTLGLISGLFLGYAFNKVLDSAIAIDPTQNNLSLLNFIHSLVYLTTCYIGLVVTQKSSEEFYLSIPFVKFQPQANKKKDILIDVSLLLDPRIIDLASCGLLDNQLIIPRFITKELYVQMENGDENTKARARRSLEVCKKLETLPSLNLRFSDIDFADIKDSSAKLIRLARNLEANIITADISRIQQTSLDGLTIINIHALSNALKPLTQSGEFINIKIQRYGKEARQGIGYLEDGTMVVVNGGAEHIGETIKAQVLSVKHTSSGRMIFCNSADEMLFSDAETDLNLSSLSAHQYFAMDGAKI